MDIKTALAPLDWTLLTALAREGKLPLAANTLKAIRHGKRRWTEDQSIETHRITGGRIPCWATRPDLFNPGTLPPCLADMLGQAPPPSESSDAQAIA